MMKGVTTKEQSMKLLELGLDPNTADMYYPNRVDIKSDYALPREAKHGNPFISQEIPCWSLSALLDVMPRYIEGEDGIFFLYFWKLPNLWWCVTYKNEELNRTATGFCAEELIDAVADRMCWLLENKYIEPQGTIRGN